MSNHVLKETERGAGTAGPAAGSPGTSDVAVGQLIDFDSDVPSSTPANAMANLCMFVNADRVCY